MLALPLGKASRFASATLGKGDKTSGPFVPGTGDRPKREADLYYVTTRKSGTTIEGKLPLTAAEALAFLRRATGSLIEIRDANARAVSLEKLRNEAASSR
jgi:hypothetical protein